MQANHSPALCALLDQYCAEQSLPFVSADELILSPLTDEQRRFISAFILVWEQADRMGCIQ